MGLNHAGFDSDYWDTSEPHAARPLYLAGLLLLYAVAVVVMPVVVLVLVAWWGWDKWRMR